MVSTAELGTRSILTPGCGAFVVHEDETAFAIAVAEALTLSKDDTRRAELRGHAQSWASQAMARRLIGFYEKVKETAALSLQQAPDNVLIKNGVHRGPR